jgi:hypothetical protein
MVLQNTVTAKKNGIKTPIVGGKRKVMWSDTGCGKVYEAVQHFALHEFVYIGLRYTWIPYNYSCLCMLHWVWRQCCSGGMVYLYFSMSASVLWLSVFSCHPGTCLEHDISGESSTTFVAPVIKYRIYCLWLARIPWLTQHHPRIDPPGKPAIHSQLFHCSSTSLNWRAAQ